MTTTYRHIALFFVILCCIATPLQAQNNATDSVYLNKSHPISEVVITGTRTNSDIRHLPMSVSVVNRSTIEQEHQPSLLPTLTQQVPSLFITSRGLMGYGVSSGAAGGMTMRGVGNSPTTGLLVLVDGQPQYMGLMGHPIADACQSMLADRVEVVRGPASVIYGSNAMGGVINIVTRNLDDDASRTNADIAYGSYNTFQAEASNQTRLGRFSSTLTASYNHTNGHRPDMAFTQYGGSAKLGYKITDNWNVAAFFNMTHFDASNPGSISQPILDNDSGITRGAASISLRNNYEKSSGALNVYYNWGRHKINDGYSPGEQPLDYRFNSHDSSLGIALYQSVSLFEGNRLTLGADMMHFGGKAWNHYLNGGADKVTADKSMNEIAVYIDVRQQLTRWMIANAGIRLDAHSHVGNEWIPQGGLTFLLTHDTQIKAMISKGFRFPTIREMYMFPPQNPHLKAERLLNYEISFSRKSSGGILNYGANIFFIDGDNMIRTQMVDGRPMNINTGKIENWGVEAELSWRAGRTITLATNYSYLNMRYPVVAAPEHKLYVGINFAKGRWSANTGVQYIAGLITQTSPVIKENYVDWSAIVSLRVAKCLSLYLRGENLLNQKYEINAGYPMPGATLLAGAKLTL